MKKSILLSVLGLFIAFGPLWAQQADSKYTLRLNNKEYVPQPNAASFVSKKSEGMRQASASGKPAYMVLQFSELPSKSEIDNFEKQGIKLTHYLENNAYFVTVSPQSAGKKYTGMDKLYSAFETSELSKIDARITENRIPEYAYSKSGKLKLTVACFEGIRKAEVLQALANLSYENLAVSEVFGFFDVEMDAAQLESLSQTSWIITISLRDADPVPYDQRNRGVSGQNLFIQRNPNANLTGKGVIAGIWDTNLEQHADVLGRLTVNQRFDPDYTADHGMHVMGIMTGTGIKDPRAAGIAPGLKIESYNYAWGDSHTELKPLADQMYAAYQNKGIRVSQNSYGPGINTTIVPKFEYSSKSANFDNLSNKAPDLLSVFAVGNSGAAYNQWSTTPYSAKNILLVGNLEETSTPAISSSRGPTLSGAIIPQVAVIGEQVYSLGFDNSYNVKSGTSMACPFVSGVAGLVYQRYKELYGQNPISSLAKAFIANGANDIFLPGPDYGTGFGEVSVPNTIEMVEKKQFFVGNISTTGDVVEYIVNIPEGTEEMKVMLSWNDPYATAESYGRTLTNNLDLEVVYDRTYLPLVPDPMFPDKPAVEKVDNLSNILQVTLKAPAKGKAKIRIKGTSVPKPAQQFAVAYRFAKKGITLLTPVAGMPINAGEDVLLKWNSVGLTGPVTVESSRDGGLSYPTKTTVVDANYLKLPVTSQLTEKIRFRISQDGQFFESGDMFIAGQVKNLKLVATPTENIISWDSVRYIKAAGGSYEILRLKDDRATYELVTDTVKTLKFSIPAALSEHPNYFTVRAKYNGNVGERAVAVEVRPIKSMTAFPLYIDFNEGMPEEIRLQQAPYATLDYKYIPDHGRSVLAFAGTLVYNSTEYLAQWRDDLRGADAVLNGYYSAAQPMKFKPKATLNVDLPAGKKIVMKVNVRVRASMQKQTDVSYRTTSDNYASFRLCANGTALKTIAGNIVQRRSYAEPIPDHQYQPFNIRIEPDKNKNIFETKYYDLSGYAGSTVSLDFEAICASKPYETNNDPMGSQVYISSISIEERKPYELVVTSIDSMYVINPLTGLAVLPVSGQREYMVNAKGLLGKPSKGKVFVQVANIGSEPTAGTVRMDIARYRQGDTIRMTANVPTLQPFKAKFLDMNAVPTDSIQFSYPESHKLLFTASATTPTVAPGVSFIEYNIDSYEDYKTFRRMNAGGQGTDVAVIDSMRFTDFGATIFPYTRYGDYGYTFKSLNPEKRLKIEFKDIDLMPGDTVVISSGSTVLGKIYGPQSNGVSFTSSAPNGKLSFELKLDPTNAAELASNRGWEFVIKEIPKLINKDLAIVSPVFARPQKFDDGVGVSLVLENRGISAIDLPSLKLSYRFAGLGKVIELTPKFVNYDPTFGRPGSSSLVSLESGAQAYMTFTQPMLGDTTLKVGEVYPMVFKIEEFTDDVADNNMLNAKVLYGDKAVADDFGPNAFVSHFAMAGVSRTENGYGYKDFSNQVIKVELGKGYPYTLILDGRQSKLLEGVFIADKNKNKVFEEVEALRLDNDGTENHNSYTGEFWPHTYFTEAGDYRFRVAAYQNGNMSAWEFTLRVVGTPISQDVELKTLTSSSSELLTSSIVELTMDILRSGYDGPTPATITYDYVNASGVAVATGTMAVPELGDARQNRSVTIPTPSGVANGSYTLKVVLNVPGETLTFNNVKTIPVTIKTELVLNTTTKSGRVNYTAPMLNPAAAGRMKASLPPFNLSNTNDGTWIIDSVAGINNWYLLSERTLRAYDNKGFYDNQLMKFTFNSATQKGTYEALPQNFNGTVIQAISFNPKSKTLYGLGAVGVAPNRKATIYTIDYITGVATLLKTFTSVSADSVSGLAVDLGGKLFTVSKNTDVLMLDPVTGDTSRFAVAPAGITSRVNMAYDYAEGTVLMACSDGTNVHSLYKVNPVENRSAMIASFGTTNKSFSLAIPAVSNPAIDTVFKLDRFDVVGQMYSFIDNDAKSVTIMLRSSANTSALTLKNYAFANSNAKFTIGGADLLNGASLNISSPITLTAKQNDGRTAVWTIKTNNATVDGAQIIRFQFLKANNPALATDITAVIANGTIQATVPSNVDIKTLVPTIQTNIPVEDERLKVGEKRIYSNATAVDFAQPILMGVSAVQLQVSASYEITITREPASLNELISFAFMAANNRVIDNDIVMKNDNGTLYMAFPRGLNRSSLVPTFTVSPHAEAVYNGIGIASNSVDVVDVTQQSITIRVVAENGQYADYQIMIKEESAEAKLLSFDALVANNARLTYNLIGTIDGQTMQVGVAFPKNVDRSSIIPTFSLSPNATLTLASGTYVAPGTALDFTLPFDVTVLAENGVARTTYRIVPIVKEADESFSPSLAPNPADSYTMLAGATGGIAYLFDAQGRLLQTINVTSDAHRIDLAKLAGGAYYIRVDKDGEQRSVKLLKK